MTGNGFSMELIAMFYPILILTGFWAISGFPDRKQYDMPEREHNFGMRRRRPKSVRPSI
jgi:hypothetical protein